MHSTASPDWLLVLEIKLGSSRADAHKANLYPPAVKKKKKKNDSLNSSHLIHGREMDPGIEARMGHFPALLSLPQIEPAVIENCLVYEIDPRFSPIFCSLWSSVPVLVRCNLAPLEARLSGQPVLGSSKALCFWPGTVEKKK